jgi:uncharacterized protein
MARRQAALRAPEMIAKFLIGLVKGYRVLLSPSLGLSCRFEPTCSRYAIEALEKHGASAGSYLSTKRLLKCHPWCEGGQDPVPEQRPRIFSGLIQINTEKKSS